MKTTDVVVDKKQTEVQVKVKMKVQAVLQKNLRTPLGMFHGKELNERGFVNDLFKNFNIIPK